jgi:hypothetical protein
MRHLAQMALEAGIAFEQARASWTEHQAALMPRTACMETPREGRVLFGEGDATMLREGVALHWRCFTSVDERGLA